MGDPKGAGGLSEQIQSKSMPTHVPPVALGLRQAVLSLSGWEELIDFPLCHGLISLCAGEGKAVWSPGTDSVPALGIVWPLV